MSAGTSELFCLIVCFLICCSEALEIITAELGQDVILPCKAPKNINAIGVEWIRPGLDPEYVFIYRDRRLDPHNQHPSYKNRVDLQDKDMKDGNISLVLKNMMKTDTGRYECWVFEEGKIDPINNITLEVYLPGKKFEGDQDGNTGDGGDKDGGNKTGITVGSVVGVILLLLAVVSVGFLSYRQYRKQNPHLPVPRVEPPPIAMSAISESPVEPPTASEALMEAPAEEQSENVK